MALGQTTGVAGPAILAADSKIVPVSPDETALFDLYARAERGQLPREVDRGLAQPGPQAGIRRGYRRRRRPWPRDRLLPRQGAWAHQHRGPGQGLAGRR